MNRSQKVLQLFEQGANCAQSILAVYANHKEIDDQLALRIGSGLGGGLGRKQYICGAVNAGAILISMEYGNSYLDEVNKKEKSGKKVNEFLSKIESELGDPNCSKLLNFDISSEAGKKNAKEMGLFEDVCTKCLSVVAIQLEKFLIR
jgi:C_GCAxxG_C_C family probable redox protein